MKIRRATLEDTGQISMLYYNTVTNINIKDYSKREIEVWASSYSRIDKWQEKIKEQYFIVSEEDKIITGFASITEKGYLDFMYVHKDHQGKGIATRLLSELEKFADTHDLNEIWAQVSITARPFFKCKGFEITKEFVTKMEDVEFNDAIMTKTRIKSIK